MLRLPSMDYLIVGPSLKKTMMTLISHRQLLSKGSFVNNNIPGALAKVQIKSLLVG